MHIKYIPGSPGILPDQDKPFIWRSKTTTQNIIECIQICAPSHAWNQDRADFLMKALKITEPIAINRVDFLSHDLQPEHNRR